MSTNYFNTLIEIAEDSHTAASVEPDATKQTVATQQYTMIAEHPYEYTSDDVIFARVAEKQGIGPDEIAQEQANYFAQGRACLRTSPLAKQYGWGIHANAEGKVALIPVESPTYAELKNDPLVTKVKAMRRAKA